MRGYMYGICCCNAISSYVGIQAALSLVHHNAGLGYIAIYLENHIPIILNLYSQGMH